MFKRLSQVNARRNKDALGQGTLHHMIIVAWVFSAALILICKKLITQPGSGNLTNFGHSLDTLCAQRALTSLSERTTVCRQEPFLSLKQKKPWRISVSAPSLPSGSTSKELSLKRTLWEREWRSPQHDYAPTVANLKEWYLCARPYSWSHKTPDIYTCVYSVYVHTHLTVPGSRSPRSCEHVVASTSHHSRALRGTCFIKSG